MELGNILDEQDISNKTNVGIKLELKKLAWWSKAMGTLAIVGASLFLFFATALILTEHNLPLQPFLFFFTWSIASIIIIFFSLSIFAWAKKTKEYLSSETEDDFNFMAKKNHSSWRLGTFVFLFMGVPVMLIISNELYKSYYRDNYLIEEPAFPEPAFEEPPSEPFVPNEF